mgnify:FL=1
MKKFSAQGQKWLKCFHLVFVSLWVSGVVTMTLMIFVMKASHGMELYGIDISKKFVDDFIIIPGAIGSFITGLLYSIFTKWGWFKHRWITVKWIITLFGMMFGTFFLGPWLNAMPPISMAKGLAALSDTAYMHSQQMLYIWTPLTLALVLFALFISVLKPWRKRKA